MLHRFFATLAVATLISGAIVLPAFSVIPTAFAEEGGGGGGGGGSSSGGGSSGSSSGGGHGAHRGHNMNVIYTVARFMLSHAQLPGGAFGGTDATPLSSDEKHYLCSMQKYLQRLHSPIHPEVVAYIANLLGRSADVIELGLRNPGICQ